MPDITDFIRQLSIQAIPILIAITFHEVAHGYVAFKLGDPTAKSMGRLTLNPFAHIDPFGTVIMPILLLIMTSGQFTFGYAKPVPIDPRYFDNPKRDMAISAAAGPVTNILMALLCAILLRVGVSMLGWPGETGAVSFAWHPIFLMLKAAIIINLVFAVFNMIPLPPLDGGRVLMGFLPYRQAVALGKIEPYGFFIVMFLMATHVTDFILGPMVYLLLKLIGMGLF